MIVLNLLNRLFGSGGRLTRRDIDRYQSAPQNQQRIEEQVANDSFDDNALDGWRESGLDTSAMSELDKKMAARFEPKSPLSGSFALVLLFISIAGMIMVYRYFSATPESIELAETNAIQDFFDERSDLEMSPEINQFEEIDAIEQVQPEALVEKFAKKQTQQAIQKEESAKPDKPTSTTQSTDNDNIRLSTNTNNQQITSTSQQPNRLVLRNAAEVYLHNLKLIDYRAYRSGTISTERLQYSGTPANQSEPESYAGDEMVWKEVQVPYHEYLDKTIALFSKRKYKQALQRFETILVTYPDDRNANFYSALCLYNLGQYQTALERLNLSYSADFGNFYEEALWYKAKTHDKLKESNKAREVYQRIVDEKGFYAQEALKALQ
jgi:hypothetical protein